MNPVTVPVPTALEAERAVLGSLLLDRDSVIRVAGTLEPGDFFHEGHAAIYAAILALYARREPPDLVTVTSELQRHGTEALAGGSAYLVGLWTATPTAVHIDYYAGIVLRAALGRNAIQAGSRIAGLGYDQDLDSEALLVKIEAEIARLRARRRARSAWVDAGRGADTVLDALQAQQAGTARPAVPTGFPTLDSYLSGGFYPGQLIYLAARTSRGKTAFGLNLARNAARAGKPTGVVSREMDAASLIKRHLAMESRTDLGLLRSAALGAHDWDRLVTGMRALFELPLFLCDDPTIDTVGGIHTAAIQLQTDPLRGLAFLVVDYIQLFHDRAARTREAEIAAVSRDLKQLGRVLGVPVLVQSQLNRAAIGDDRPELHHLRESGQQEQDADVVLFLHRPDAEHAPQRVHVIIGKNRDGEADVEVPLDWQGAYQRFCEPGHPWTDVPLQEYAA